MTSGIIARMDRLEVSDAERAAARITSATRLFYVLGLLKVFSLLNALRLLGPGAEGRAFPTPAGLDARSAAMLLVVWYLAGVALCVILARGVRDRRIWARNIGLAWGVFHVAGLFFVARAGVPAIINGLLGFILTVTLLLAAALGAFDRDPRPVAEH